MNYISINNCNSEDYLGFSVTLAVSGCSHKCKGCWAVSSWNRNTGSPFTEETYQELYRELNQSFISNLVIQGGDGMFSANYQDTINLCRRIKQELPDIRIVLFTGYTLSQLQNDLLRSPILDTIDILIDGKYEKDNPTKKPFRGSGNQCRYKLEKGVATFID